MCGQNTEGAIDRGYVSLNATADPLSADDVSALNDLYPALVTSCEDSPIFDAQPAQRELKNLSSVSHTHTFSSSPSSGQCFVSPIVPDFVSCHRQMSKANTRPIYLVQFSHSADWVVGGT